MSLVIVDLDNTLVDRVAAFHRWATQFLLTSAAIECLDQLIALDEDGFRPDRTSFAR